MACSAPVVATLAIYLPSSLVVYGAVSWWLRKHGSPWRAAIEQGLAPVAVGLIFAGVLAVTQAAHLNALGLATTAVSATVLYLHPDQPLCADRHRRGALYGAAVCLIALPVARMERSGMRVRLPRISLRSIPGYKVI